MKLKSYKVKVKNKIKMKDWGCNVQHYIMWL